MGKILNIAKDISSEVITNDSTSAYLVTAVTGGDNESSVTYLYIFITDVPLGETDEVAKDFFDTLQKHEQRKWPDYYRPSYDYGAYPSFGIYMAHADKTDPQLVNLNFYNIRKNSQVSFSMSKEKSSSMFFTLKKEREAKTERYKQYLELRREFEGK
jgi:hypothetical protein